MFSKTDVRKYVDYSLLIVFTRKQLFFFENTYVTKKYKLDFVEPHILFVYVSMNVAEVKTKSCYTDHTSKNAEMIDFVVTACY